MITKPDKDAGDVKRTLKLKLRWRWSRRTIGYAVTLAVMAAVTWLIVSQTGNRPPAPAQSGGFRAMMQGAGPGGRGDVAVPVLAATARTADVPVYYDGVGTTKALNTVTVRSQVDGKLLRLNFREGEDVEKGFVLAEIDPIVYQAQLDQAVAKKAQDEAQLANARIDLERYTRLALTNAGTKQQADTQKALVAQLEAQVKADQASIDNQQAYLDYTRVVAPISGRTGIRLVDVGNLVRASESTGIVVITQLRPIYVVFTLPQQQLPAVNKAFGRNRLEVLALGTDNRSVIDRGSLQVIDNQVDQTTGTVRMRAEFPNKDLQLWPGQFVNVKLLVDTLEQVVVVPTAAVQRGPNGTFTYVIGGDSKVSVRPVSVAQQDDQQAVLASGITSGERVVTTGFTQLADGKRVIVSNNEPNTAAPGAAPERRGRRPMTGTPETGAAAGTPPSGAPAAGPSEPSRADEQPANEQRRRRSEGAGSGSAMR